MMIHNSLVDSFREYLTRKGWEFHPIEETTEVFRARKHTHIVVVTKSYSGDFCFTQSTGQKIFERFLREREKQKKIADIRKNYPRVYGRNDYL